MLTRMVSSSRVRWLLPRLGIFLGSLAASIFALLVILPQFTGMPLRHSIELLIRPGGVRYVYHLYDGDIFYFQPGIVRPPPENEVLADEIVYYNEDGFRESAIPGDDFRIVALGDSFTEGQAFSWVDTLSKTLKKPIRNLGWRGWGPLEYAAVFQQYPDEYDWVVIGYFEGNDLGNIQTSLQNGNLNLNREQVAEDENRTPPSNDDDFYLYPLITFVGENAYDMAYVDDYLWWLNAASPDVFTQSENVRSLGESLQQIKTAAGGACVALVYIPTKPHIYIPYAYSEGKITLVLENGSELILDEAGWLTLRDGEQDYATVMARMNTQRDVIQALAADLNLHFIDLVPVLEAAAIKEDDLLYYAYDTHFNEHGHQVTGEAVADYLRDHDGECGE